MTQARLNNLLMMYVHDSVAESLDLVDVGNQFVSVNSRRKHYFGIIKIIKIIVKWLLSKTGFAARRKRGVSKIAARFARRCTKKGVAKMAARFVRHSAPPCYIIFLRL